MKSLSFSVFLASVFVLGSAASAHDGQLPGGGNLAKSPVILAGVEAAHQFAKDFEAASGTKLSSEFLGFYSNSADDEIAAEAYSVVSPREAASDSYGCHLHGGDEAHCHAEGQRRTFGYSVSGRSFSVEEFEISAEEAVAVFEAKVGDPALIEKAKFWRVGGEIQVSLKWTPS
ncbi:MAG: hypothetical protein HC902_03060, partial [Calothrix sp. SM1_5_4]|nr:hypothetical protein [Calothrix sp. SM1_5_4]